MSGSNGWRKALDDVFHVVFAETGEENASALWREARGRIEDDAEGGSVLLEAMFDAFINEHGQQEASRFLSRREQSTFTTMAGRTVEMKASRGVRKRNATTGAPERAWQQRLWYEMTWDELAEHFAMLIRQWNVAGHQIEALRDVFRLREQYPETQTPLEACEQAGIDPRAFAIERAA